MKLSYPGRVAIACMAFWTARVLHVRSRETGDGNDSMSVIVFVLVALASLLFTTVVFWLLDWVLCIFFCCVRRYLCRSLGAAEFEVRIVRLDALFYPAGVDATAPAVSTEGNSENTQPKTVNQ